jgi:hypothetical protein
VKISEKTSLSFTLFNRIRTRYRCDASGVQAELEKAMLSNTQQIEPGERP